MLEKVKLISFDGLKTFWENIKSWFQPKLDRLDRKVWMGKESELQAAIDAGIIDDTTVIVITDGESGLNMYEFATYGDILALFPEYM